MKHPFDSARFLNLHGSRDLLHKYKRDENLMTAYQFDEEKNFIV